MVEGRGLGREGGAEGLWGGPYVRLVRHGNSRTHFSTFLQPLLAGRVQPRVPTCARPCPAPPKKNPENLPGGRSEWLFTVVTHYTASGSLLSCFLAEGRNSEKIRDAFFVRKPQISKVILDKGVSLEVKTTTTLTEQARRIVSGFLNAV